MRSGPKEKPRAHPGLQKRPHRPSKKRERPSRRRSKKHTPRRPPKKRSPAPPVEETQQAVAPPVEETQQAVAPPVEEQRPQAPAEETKLAPPVEEQRAQAPLQTEEKKFVPAPATKEETQQAGSPAPAASEEVKPPTPSLPSGPAAIAPVVAQSEASGTGIGVIAPTVGEPPEPPGGVVASIEAQVRRADARRSVCELSLGCGEALLAAQEARSAAAGGSTTAASSFIATSATVAGRGPAAALAAAGLARPSAGTHRAPLPHPHPAGHLVAHLPVARVPLPQSSSPSPGCCFWQHPWRCAVIACAAGLG